MLRLLTGKPGGRTCDGSDSFASTGRRYGHKSELNQSFYYRSIFPAGLSGNASIIIKCEGIMWSGKLQIFLVNVDQVRAVDVQFLGQGQIFVVGDDERSF